MSEQGSIRHGERMTAERFGSYLGIRVSISGKCNTMEARCGCGFLLELSVHNCERHVVVVENVDNLQIRLAM
eukprot:scaffold555470_cov24-Prasinocladus_malaysianus.AAC.1